MSVWVLLLADGRTPLHLASAAGHIDVVMLLVGKCGALITAQDGSDDSPLHCAARTGMIEVVRYLLEAGAPTDLTNAQGFTPGEEALLSGSIDCAVAIADWKESQRHAAVNDRRVSSTQAELAAVSSPKRFRGGFTILHLVSGLQRWDSVSWLLSNSSTKPKMTPSKGSLMTGHEIHGECVLTCKILACFLLLFPF